MLAAIGVPSVDDLFADVPAHVRFPDLNLPPALSEMEARRELENLAKDNFTAADGPCFLGAGAYHHYVPAVVDAVLRRGEFYTAYTPYQPEVSQGTLQAIFEYQTMICALTGMEVSNASHYDGATATAEAAITAVNVHRMKRRKIAISSYVHPEYRDVVRTYTQGMGLEIGGWEIGDPLDRDTACAIVQYPDFLGRIEDLGPLAEATHAAGALLIAVADPIALGLLKPPGEFGADIVVGEAVPGILCHPRGVRAQDGGPAGGPDGGRRGQAWLCPHPLDARAAHSPGKGHVQYLHQPGVDRAGGGGLYGRSGALRDAAGGRAMLP
jgi:glycine dehydrogenase subunit 1